MMLLLFLYNVPSERELMEQIEVRLDFLWFLDFDLDTNIPDHSVLSKARARWGEEIFEQLFLRMLQQCVDAGLVGGSLLHIDSTIVKASASKDSVVSSSPELVSALRQAYQKERSKLEVLPAQTQADPPATQPAAPAAQAQESTPVLEQVSPPTLTVVDSLRETNNPPPRAPASSNHSSAPQLREMLPVSADSGCQDAEPSPQSQKAVVKRLPVNSTHISRTDPEPS
jgi:hypothetical protein